MNKKIFCIALTAILMLAMVACGHQHSYGDWTVVTEASCTNGGVKERSCECGEKETENIAPNGHTYSESVALTEVSCTQDGEVEKTCAICGVTETETVKATGHAFSAATAFAPKTCKNCGLTEGEPLATLIAVGDVMEGEDHSFSVEKAEYTGALKDKRGNITYNYSGGHVYVIKLDFTNLAAEAFDRWNSDRVSDVSMEYKGKYQYEGEYWCPVDDIVPLGNDAMYIVYEVPESMADDSTSSIFATFTIDNETYAMVVQEGDGSEEAIQEENAAADVAADLTIGDVRTDGENFSFEVKDIYYTNKPSQKDGNITYSFGTGAYYLAMKLDFTNLASEALESWGTDRIDDMKLSFAGKYDYDGQIWIPGNDIVPLGNGNVYVLFEIPQTVEDSADPLVMTFSVDGHEFTVDCRAI